jgi:hypothetical protein
VTDDLRERLLCIPLYHDLSDDRIDGIAGIIRRSLGSTHHYAACGSPGPGGGRSRRGHQARIIRVDAVLGRPSTTQGPTAQAGSIRLGESTSAFAEKPVTTDPVRCT